MEEKIYIVGQVFTDDGKEWALVGLFWDKDRALQACRTTAHFIATTIVDRDYGDIIEEFEECVYPLLEEKPSWLL